jgi:DMSO reductase anchor subunit
MHPAPSVILFTVLSGAGFGFLFFLNLGLAGGTGLGVLPAYALAFVLAMAGLVASTFHLGNPQRALRAFSQWRTSWLSREGWFSVGALGLSALTALDRTGGGRFSLIGVAAAMLCAATILATAMIYAQLKTVPRWNHWTTPLTFFAFAATGGLILSARGWPAGLMCLILGAVMVLAFREGDRQFLARGQTINAATGLAGEVRPFAPPHTSPNYVMTEMIHQVGRKHARKLRLIALLAAGLIPAALLLVLPAGLPAALLAFAVHLCGALAQRWLFFAEAEHVVSHYYGRPAG